MGKFLSLIAWVIAFISLLVWEWFAISGSTSPTEHLTVRDTVYITQTDTVKEVLK